MADADEWAAGLPVPGYAIDDQSAIKVTGGTVEVVSDGHWKLAPPAPLGRRMRYVDEGLVASAHIM